MSVPTPPPAGGGDPLAGGASFLGSASQVMQSIFDLGDEPAAEPEGTPEGAPAEPAGEPGGEGAPAGGEAAPEPADAGENPAAGEGAPETPAAPERPVVTADDQAVVEQFTQASAALEERFTQHYQSQVVQQFQEEYSHYTELLDLHPMELVGKEVPPIDGSDQMVVFRSSAEAKEYQEAVKTVLGRMMRSEVEKMREADEEVLTVVHNSIELFQANPDLVPGSKSFNQELAEQVMSLVEPYALRMDGKLTGFSIDIQGIVDQTRGRLKQTKQAAPAPAAPAKKSAARKPAAPPQGGIASKAGTSGGEAEDFSAMWGALGVPSMPI